MVDNKETNIITTSISGNTSLPIGSKGRNRLCSFFPPWKLPGNSKQKYYKGLSSVVSVISSLVFMNMISFPTMHTVDYYFKNKI